MPGWKDPYKTVEWLGALSTPTPLTLSLRNSKRRIEPTRQIWELDSKVFNRSEINWKLLLPLSSWSDSRASFYSSFCWPNQLPLPIWPLGPLPDGKYSSPATAQWWEPRRLITVPDSLSWFSFLHTLTHKKFNKNMDYGRAQEPEINDSLQAVSVILSCWSQ